MKKTLILAFLLIIILPILLLVWIGWISIRGEQERFTDQIMTIQQERLLDHVEKMELWRADLENRLASWLTSLQSHPIDQWSTRCHENRFALRVFSLTRNGHWEFPNPQMDPLTEADSLFMQQFREYLPLMFSPSDNADTPSQTRGWITWYEGPGPQWAFWTRNSDGSTYGMILDRSALLAEMISRLPDESRTANMDKLKSRYAEPAGETFALVSEDGQTLYQWGAMISAEHDPLVRIGIPLLPPFAMWKFEIRSHGPDQAHLMLQPQVLTLLAGLLLTAGCVILIGAYLFWFSRREFILARQRVSFVNQVSHELKTPLTNIQLYSELMEDEVEEGPAHSHLSIIQEECGKLSRMVQNVLTFARQQKQTLRLHPREVVPSVIIQQCVEAHRIGLERRGIQVTCKNEAGQPQVLDPDVLCQIIGNLLSNAEKYASGAPMLISAHQDQNTLHLHVHDGGPGIPKTQAGKVFEPFVRLENRITEGVSGAGIGLSIARDLARLHGGDLILIPEPSGAHFHLTLSSNPS